MNVRKFMCWVLGLALVFGLLPMANPTYADESQGLQAQTMRWHGLEPAGHVSEPNSHVLIAKSSARYFPSASTNQRARITYSSDSDKVTVDRESGALQLVSDTDLPTGFVTITATAEAVNGYRETSISYKLYVKNYFEPLAPENLQAVDAEANGTGKITGTTAKMEYAKHRVGFTFEEQAFHSCAEGETTGLVPGKYVVRFKETETYHPGGYYTLIHIKTKNTQKRTLTLENSKINGFAPLEYYAGDEVVIAPGHTNSSVFQGWTVGSGVALAAVGGGSVDLKAVPLSFVMPDQDITLTANWEKVQRRFQYLMIDNREKKYHTYAVGAQMPTNQFLVLTDELSDTLTYALKESNTQGISIDAQTGKVSVDTNIFKQFTKVKVVVTATDYRGEELNSDEYTLYVKPMFPIQEFFMERVRVQQPTKAGEKGVVAGAEGLEYKKQGSGADYVPCGFEPLELDLGTYIFRYKELEIETDPYLRGNEVKFVDIKLPSDNSESGNSGEGSTSESSSDISSSTSIPSVTEPAPQAEVKPVGNTEDKRVVAAVAAETKVTGTEVRSNIAAAVVEQAVAAAEQAIKSGNNAGVEIEVKTHKNTNSMSLSLSTTALKTVAESKAESVTVKSGISNITLDKDALTSIAKQSKGNITLSVEKAESKLNQKQKEAIGDAPVYDINLRSGESKIKSFDGGKLTISIPYSLKVGEKANGVVVWYVDDHGNIEKMETEYDEASKTVVFKTTHLSKYAIGYEEKAAAIQAWMNPFQDVADSAWYYEAVKFVAEKELMHGTSATMFKPALGVTRGMLVAVLYRMEGSPEVGAVSAFADVNPDAYYAKAVAWAQKNGIVEGIGHNKFAPKQQATREQLAVVLRNYAVFKKQSVESMETTANFEGVSSWAVDAMKWSAANGIFQGNQEGEFLPKQNATRAELAKVLKKFLELKK